MEADGLVLNAPCRGTSALCHGTPAGFRLGRKSQRGVCPQMEEPTLGEQVTVPQGSRGSRARVSLAGAPPSSPNPSKFPTANHDPPGARRPRGRSLRRPPALNVQGTPRIRLQGTSASAWTPTISCSHSSRLQCPRNGLESPEMPIVGSDLWGWS